MEIWKNIENYPDYMVSNLGRVKSIKFGKEKLLKHSKDKYGYFKVLLSKNGKSKNLKIHRLVAKAFIPNPDNKEFIDHINTNKTDNRVENLRWCTCKENQNNPNTLNNIDKANKRRCNKPILQFTLDNCFVKLWVSASEIEKKLGFDHSMISRCCLNKVVRCYGYKWQYYDNNNSIHRFLMNTDRIIELIKKVA